MHSLKPPCSVLGPLWLVRPLRTLPHWRTGPGARPGLPPPFLFTSAKQIRRKKSV